MAAMLSGRLHKFLTATTVKPSKPQVIFWFSLSLTFTIIYGFLALKQAFSSEYVVQDDARQHVFWMQRFLQPDLFPQDLIANYFQSVAPAGYTTFYRLFASLGINPLLLSKILPVFLAIITTAYCFGVCLKLFPVPAAGFIATLLLNQSLWLKDDLVSATPRAFIYPIFLGFLYYMVRRSLVLVCVAIALLGLFYPQGIFNAAIILILQLIRWDRGLPKLSHQRRDYLFCAAGLAVTVLVLLPAASLLGVTLLLYPSFDSNPNTKYKVGSFPSLYQFFQSQPQDSLTASLAEEANNLPTFAQRSILVGREYAIPYQLGYYRQFRQRTLDLISAQYSPNLTAAQNLIHKYRVDFWLLDKTAFTPEYMTKNSWLKQYQPATAEAITLLQQKKTPALSQLVERCKVFDRDSFVVLKTDCITKTQQKQP